jgi:hypothetical protein
VHKTLIWFLLNSSVAFSQLTVGALAWTGKFEFTQTQKGGQAYDSYFLGHGTKMELLGRGFFAKDGLKRGEFAAGKGYALLKDKKSKPRLVLIPYAGLTTDGAIFTPVVLTFNLWGRNGDYIFDPKFYYNGKANTIYQESTFALVKSGRLQVRSERLDILPNPTAFHRLGLQWRLWNSGNIQVSVSPFADLVHKQAGFYSGFTW